MSKGAVKFLVSLGNMFNDEATSTTPLQKLRYTPNVEKAWVRRRTAMRWFHSVIGQSAHDQHKFEFICEMCKDYWPSYNNYEISQSFYAAAIQLTASNFDVDDDEDADEYEDDDEEEEEDLRRRMIMMMMMTMTTTTMTMMMIMTMKTTTMTMMTMVVMILMLSNGDHDDIDKATIAIQIVMPGLGCTRQPYHHGRLDEEGAGGS